ncbi:MAG: hypothetical protein IJW96_01825 [Clostridia bacterium]|nr:hypothetical protein [Clostridia bacterium]
MKKMMTTLCMVLALGMGAGVLTGCFNNPTEAKAEEQKVMNISLNPQVEFVLDTDDTVISVNALNEEGNLIISAEAFENIEGKTAEEAAKLFVEVSKETGYLVQGSLAAGNNQINISLSGDAEKAEELYNEMKAKMTEYLNSVDVTAKIEQATAITEAKIKALLAECEPYLETAKMEYKELVEALAQSRKETAEFYSQELKNAYYEAKEIAMQMAELETLRSHLGILGQGAFDALTVTYEMAVETIETTRMNLLVNEDSLYQRALAYFRELKTEYLKARNEFSIGDATIVVEITEEELAEMKAKVEEAEAKFIQAAADANATLDSLKLKVTEGYNKLVEVLTKYSVAADNYLTEISATQKAKQEEFFQNFEEKYAQIIEDAKKQWTDMETELEGEAEQA